VLIEIRGVQFVNKGAELMLRAIIEKLNDEMPHAEICLQHTKNSPYLKRAEVGAFQKVNLCKNILDLNGLTYFIPASLRRYFKNRFGIVTEADIDVVLDASGFSYGDQWSNLILRQVATMVKRFKHHKKHYVFMPQSLGPFSFDNNKKYAKKAFSNASLVFAREKPSYQHVTELIADPIKIKQAPDFTNLLKPAESAEYVKYQDYIIVIPNSKMLSEKNSNTWWRENYISTLAGLANSALRLGEKVIILNHSGREDDYLCRELKGLLVSPCEIVEPDNAVAVKALIARGKIVISSRFHGCVSALSQAVPCIATGWSHKYQELFKEYSSDDLLLPEKINEQRLNTLFTECLEKHDDRQEKLIKDAFQYQQQSEEMWQLVLSVLR